MLAGGCTLPRKLKDLFKYRIAVSLEVKHLETRQDCEKDRHGHFTRWLSIRAKIAPNQPCIGLTAERTFLPGTTLPEVGTDRGGFLTPVYQLRRKLKQAPFNLGLQWHRAFSHIPPVSFNCGNGYSNVR